MRILIEAHHPAHIHFWKHVVRELLALGDDVLLVGRDRDVMRRLLNQYDWIPHLIPTQASRNNRIPVIEFLRRQVAVASRIRAFKPDVVTSLMGSYAQTAGILGLRNIIFTDSEFQHFNHRIAHPFATEIHTPYCFYKDLGRKQHRYRGIHELAFLHPRRFHPDPPVLARYPGLEPRKYVLIRLSAWNTLHDRKHQGVGNQLVDFVETAAANYSVIISGEEGHVPEPLRGYSRAIAPEDFHQLLAHAAFILSEGASTAAEGACLGIPTVYINSTEPRGYLLMLEETYSLVRCFRETGPGMACALQKLTGLGCDEFDRLQAVRDTMVAEHIDVTSHVVDILKGKTA